MTHHHDHHHAVPDMQLATSKRMFIIGIILNMLYVIAEVIAGLITNSIALLTDAGHNLSDVSSLILSLLAFRLAAKPSSGRYTYGFKKTTVMAALINAMILILSVAVLGYESATRFGSPRKIDGSSVSLVAGIGILINAGTALLFFRQKDKELNVRAAYLHMAADALVSAGVVVAGILINFTSWYWIDPLAGVIIMIVILVSTWTLLKDSFNMAVDAVPHGMDLQAIKEVIRRHPYVVDVNHVHVWALSTTENALTAHVMIDESLSFPEKLAVVKEIKHSLRHHDIHHCTIELDQKFHDV